MNEEIVLAATVRDWAGGALPGVPAAADAAVDLALRCYSGGASFSEALSEARRFVASWARHPAHPAPEPTRRVLVAS